MPPVKLTFQILDVPFSVHRFPPDHSIPDPIWKSPVYNITKTDEELSIVCSTAILLDSEQCEHGWSCLKVLGPLDFALTGILANITAILSDEQISVFAMSTYDTDYILVKSGDLLPAQNALSTHGHTFINLNGA